MTYNPNWPSGEVSIITFAAYLSANQSIPGGSVDTLIQFDTEILDSDGYYDNATFLFTPLIAGFYRVWMEIYGTTLATSKGFVPRFYFNGANAHTGPTAFNYSAASNNVYGYAQWVLQFNGTTDNLGFYVANTDTVARNLTGVFSGIPFANCGGEYLHA